MTPTPSDFVEILVRQGVEAERAEHIVSILHDAELPRLAKFAMLAGAMGFPPKEAATLARELDEQKLVVEVNALAKRAAEAEAKLRDQSDGNAHLIGRLLHAHKIVWECESQLVKHVATAPDFAKTKDGRTAWAQLGKARNLLNEITRAWINAGAPGVIEPANCNREGRSQ